MKRLSAVVTIIALNMAFSASVEAYPGQQHVFTSGSLNVNMCTTKGSGCHIPKIIRAPVARQPLGIQPALTNVSPTGTITVNPPGIVTRIMSLF
jgi:hypothetical protein